MNAKKFLVPSLLIRSFPALMPRVFSRRALQKPASNDSCYASIDTFIEQQRRHLNIPGVSLAIVRGDEIVHLRGFGKARPHGQAPSPQTPFLIGSLTKSFTALAVMQLVETGKMELDVPVRRYLPWFRVADPQASAQITVRHLLNQTSGIPTLAGEITLADFDNRPGATRRQARALSTLVLSRSVGSAFEYSNTNYNLLGLIIEAVSAETYADYIQKYILNPLGMRHTCTSQARVSRNDRAMGHRYWFSIPFAAPNMPVPLGSLPAGLLISCAQDLAHYMIALLNEGRYDSAQILSGLGIAEMQRGVHDVRVMGLVFGQYGMGWFDDKIGKTRIVWHSGTLPDFASYIALLPEQKKGVVLLFNASHHWMNPVLTEFGTGVAARLAGEPTPSRPWGSIIPWMLRAQLLLPALQIIDVSATLLLRRAPRDSSRHPGVERKRALLLLPAVVANGLGALALLPMLGQRRRYLKLYMPDYTLIALVCGSVSLLWSLLRTGLLIRALSKSLAAQTTAGHHNKQPGVLL